MDPRDIIQELKAMGLSEVEISRRLTKLGVKVSQSTVNRIATGLTTNPSYRVGRALASLHRGLIVAAQGNDRRDPLHTHPRFE